MTNEEMYEVIRDVEGKRKRGMKAFQRPAFGGKDKVYEEFLKRRKGEKRNGSVKRNKRDDNGNHR